MSQTKKVAVSVSAEDYSLLCSLSENGSAEEYVQKLVEKQLCAERLKRGYAETAQINLELAQMCFEADEQGSRLYEEYIKHSVESEKN